MKKKTKNNKNSTLNVRNNIVPRSGDNSIVFKIWTIQRRIFDVYCLLLSRLIKYSIKLSNIYPLIFVISFSEWLSVHNLRIFKTNIGNWSIEDVKSMVNIISINARFSGSVNGSVLNVKSFENCLNGICLTYFMTDMRLA